MSDPNNLGRFALVLVPIALWLWGRWDARRTRTRG
jgi:hypothetical protein